MTKLEEELLGAFESLSREHAQQHAESLAAGNALRQMFEATSRENAELRKQVQGLSAAVERLTGLLTPSSPSGTAGGRPSRR